MSKYCPIVGRKVVYLDCQECDDRVLCERPTMKILPKPVVDDVQTSNSEMKEEPPSDQEVNIACPCDNCCHNMHSSIDWLFGRKAKIVICRMYDNAVIDVKRVAKTGCNNHNRDMSQERICMNCEHYLGGSDWGLSCAAEYHRLTNATSEACKDYKKTERCENDGKGKQ